MSHANARLTPMGRLLIVQRIQGGMPQAHVAAQMGLSRATVAKWWHRWVEEGEAGLVDRPSRPHRSPRRTGAKTEAKVCRLRRQKRWGPARIAARLGLPASTVHKVLVRNGLNRLSHIDRPTGRPIRRYERPHPGDLVHLDVKKVGKVPPGGGWRAHGRANTRARGSKRRPRVGYSYLHVAIDDHSRLAYVEAHDNETAQTLVGFLRFPLFRGDMLYKESHATNAKKVRSGVPCGGCSDRRGDRPSGGPCGPGARCERGHFGQLGAPGRR